MIMVLLFTIYFLLMVVFALQENRLFSNGVLSHRARAERKQKRHLAILIILGALLCALRNVDHTYDTRNYVNWYLQWEISSFSAFFQLSGEVEAGFELLSRFIKVFCRNNYVLYLGIISGLILTISSVGLWHLTEKRLASYLLFYVFFGLYYSYIVLRQGIAMAIILCTIAKCIKNKRYCCLKFLFGLFVAFLFHSSALVCIIMLPCLCIKQHVKRPQMYIVGIVALILSGTVIEIRIILKLTMYLSKFFALEAIQSKLSVYFLQAELVNSINYSALIVFALIAILIENRFLRERGSSALLSIENVGIIMCGILSGLPIGYRFVHYYLMPQCVLLPNVNRKIDKRVNIAIVLLVGAWYMLHMYVYLQGI